MSKYDDIFIVPARWAYLVILGLLLAGCIFVYFKYNLDPKAAGLLGGLIAGLIGIIIQYLMDWRKHRLDDRFSTFKIREILPARKDKNYYQRLLSKAEREVKVLGVTAQRFLADFADAESAEKVLIDQMNRNQAMIIKILVANKDNLQSDDDKNKYDMAARALAKLATDYPNRFQYRYYTHIPTHSIVQVDDELIVGPVFPEIASKHTPAIHISAESQFAEKYVSYFDGEWQKYV